MAEPEAPSNTVAYRRETLTLPNHPSSPRRACQTVHITNASVHPQTLVARLATRNTLRVPTPSRDVTDESLTVRTTPAARRDPHECAPADVDSARAAIETAVDLASRS